MAEQSGLDKNKVLARVIAKAWADAQYKQRLLKEPVAVLKEEGVSVPDNVAIRVVEDSDTTRTLVIPPPPTDPAAVQEVEERLAAGGLFVGIPL